MVTPAVWREAVAHLVRTYEMSQRRACSVTGADRSMVRYQRRRPDDAELRERLRALAAERRRFGYRRLHVLLRREGHVLNRKRTQRLYREEGLSVRKRRGRKRATGTRAPLLTLAAPNARWSVDFVHDQFADGRRFRVFNVVDDVTKECLAAVVDTSISGRRVARELTALVERRGKPSLIVSDRRGSANSPGDCGPEEGHRVHLERDARLVGEHQGTLAFHRSGQADAERHL
jgi:putative transposase